ncbi:hypothetical protein THOM_0512 [Trachipleistophora hominis]|uniref:Uncharacterized protein n=1 Tax=Trachipleistophora hominis TaxID=72359 RepID=L7JYT7_TRAHO|nr:hypothetical protein THOM_0512 [Trachipleistophora hominis]
MHRKTSANTDKPANSKGGAINTRADEESVRDMARRKLDLIIEEGVEGYERMMQLKLQREFEEMCRIGKGPHIPWSPSRTALESGHASTDSITECFSSCTEGMYTGADNAGEYDSMEAMGYEMDYLADPILGQAVPQKRCSSTCECYGTDSEVDAANERIRQGLKVDADLDALQDIGKEALADDCESAFADEAYGTGRPAEPVLEEKGAVDPFGGACGSAQLIESYEPALGQMGTHPIDPYGGCNTIQMLHYSASEWPIKGKGDPIIDTDFDRYKRDSLLYQEPDAHRWPWQIIEESSGPVNRLSRRTKPSEKRGKKSRKRRSRQRRMYGM